MKRWERIVDQLVSDIIGDGDVSRLPGAGKKLPLKDESNMPSEWRTAFKIMADHDVMPEWIAAGKRLEQLEAKLQSQIQARTQRHLSELRQARAAGAPALAARIESNWNRYREDYLKRIKGYNREVLHYNLTLPAGIPHRETLRGEALIKRAFQKAKTKL